LKTKVKKELEQLFEQHFKEKVVKITLLPPSGSYREYCRIKSNGHSVIGAYNADVKENSAFLSFTYQFRKNDIPVPEVFAVSDDQQKYLLEDLGDTTLFDFLSQTRETEGFSETIIDEYRKVLKQLPRIQIVAGKDMDYSVCYPGEAFDKQSMMWDLNYFKYYFLKLAKIPFDEQALEDDFQTFSDYLLSAPSGYFLFRDFQSRNIMLKDGGVFFIDYQGGRRGALQYDLASLLYDGKADIPPEIRNLLFRLYLDELKNYLPVNELNLPHCLTGSYLSVLCRQWELTDSVAFTRRRSIF
jgi:aminoglycoside/choline kinase family phosphotransferase